eukprot:scaffold21972_cov123-Isochrysis_galbana.AAC.6
MEQLACSGTHVVDRSNSTHSLKSCSSSTPVTAACSATTSRADATSRRTGMAGLVGGAASSRVSASSSSASCRAFFGFGSAHNGSRETCLDEHRGLVVEPPFENLTEEVTGRVNGRQPPRILEANGRTEPRSSVRDMSPCVSAPDAFW